MSFGAHEMEQDYSIQREGCFDSIFLCSHSPLCSVQAIRHAFSFLPSDMDCSQAFNYLDTQTLQPVCFIYTKFLKFLRSCLENIGLDPTSYAGHSFRRGGASFAFQSRIPVEMIKLLGNWKSDAVLLYLTVPLKCVWNLTTFLLKASFKCMAIKLQLSHNNCDQHYLHFNFGIGALF